MYYLTCVTLACFMLIGNGLRGSDASMVKPKIMLADWHKTELQGDAEYLFFVKRLASQTELAEEKIKIQSLIAKYDLEGKVSCAADTAIMGVCICIARKE